MDPLHVTLLDAAEATAGPWPDGPQPEKVRDFFAPLWRHGTARFIANVDTSLFVALATGGNRPPLALPVTATDDYTRRNAYVCSLHNQYIDYARDELFEVPSRILRVLLGWLISVGGVFFRWLQFDRAAFVNNWLLSTNLWPDVDDATLAAVLDAVVSRFGDRAVVFRSVNEAVGLAPERLTAMGARLILSRQVYINHDPETTLKKNRQLKNDRRNIRRAGWKEDGAALLQHAPERAQALYNALYLDKYSKNNPMFSAELLSHWAASGSLWFTSYARDDDDDHASTSAADSAADNAHAYGGVIGAFSENGLLTVPVLGYDTTRPPSDALYRLLSLRLCERAAECGLKLHASAGAAAFKRFRGATAAIEYHAVFTAHLPWWRRAAWAIFSWGSVHLAAPLFRRYEV